MDSPSTKSQFNEKRYLKTAYKKTSKHGQIQKSTSQSPKLFPSTTHRKCFDFIWFKHEILTWLRKYNFSQFIPHFNQNDIHGIKFYQLSYSNLKQIRDQDNINASDQELKYLIKLIYTIRESNKGKILEMLYSDNLRAQDNNSSSQNLNDSAPMKDVPAFKLNSKMIELEKIYYNNDTAPSLPSSKSSSVKDDSFSAFSVFNSRNDLKHTNLNPATQRYPSQSISIPTFKIANSSFNQSDANYTREYNELINKAPYFDSLNVSKPFQEIKLNIESNSRMVEDFVYDQNSSIAQALENVSANTNSNSNINSPMPLSNPHFINQSVSSSYSSLTSDHRRDLLENSTPLKKPEKDINYIFVSPESQTPYNSKLSDVTTSKKSKDRIPININFSQQNSPQPNRKSNPISFANSQNITNLQTESYCKFSQLRVFDATPMVGLSRNKSSSSNNSDIQNSNGGALSSSKKFDHAGVLYHSDTLNTINKLPRHPSYRSKSNLQLKIPSASTSYSLINTAEASKTSAGSKSFDFSRPTSIPTTEPRTNSSKYSDTSNFSDYQLSQQNRMPKPSINNSSDNIVCNSNWPARQEPDIYSGGSKPKNEFINKTDMRLDSTYPSPISAVANQNSYIISTSTAEKETKAGHQTKSDAKAETRFISSQYEPNSGASDDRYSSRLNTQSFSHDSGTDSCKSFSGSLVTQSAPVDGAAIKNDFISPSSSSNSPNGMQAKGKKTPKRFLNFFSVDKKDQGLKANKYLDPAGYIFAKNISQNLKSPPYKAIYAKIDVPGTKFTKIHISGLSSGKDIMDKIFYKLLGVNEEESLNLSLHLVDNENGALRAINSSTDIWNASLLASERNPVRLIIKIKSVSDLSYSHDSSAMFNSQRSCVPELLTQDFGLSPSYYTTDDSYSPEDRFAPKMAYANIKDQSSNSQAGYTLSYSNAERRISLEQGGEIYTSSDTASSPEYPTSNKKSPLAFGFGFPYNNYNTPSLDGKELEKTFNQGGSQIVRSTDANIKPPTINEIRRSKSDYKISQAFLETGDGTGPNVPELRYMSSFDNGNRIKNGSGRFNIPEIGTDSWLHGNRRADLLNTNRLPFDFQKDTSFWKTPFSENPEPNSAEVANTTCHNEGDGNGYPVDRRYQNDNSASKTRDGISSVWTTSGGHYSTQKEYSFNQQPLTTYLGNGQTKKIALRGVLNNFTPLETTTKLDKSVSEGFLFPRRNALASSQNFFGSDEPIDKSSSYSSGSIKYDTSLFRNSSYKTQNKAPLKNIHNRPNANIIAAELDLFFPDHDFDQPVLETIKVPIEISSTESLDDIINSNFSDLEVKPSDSGDKQSTLQANKFINTAFRKSISLALQQYRMPTSLEPSEKGPSYYKDIISSIQTDNHHKVEAFPEYQNIQMYGIPSQPTLTSSKKPLTNRPERKLFIPQDGYFMLQGPDPEDTSSSNNSLHFHENSSSSAYLMSRENLSKFIGLDMVSYNDSNFANQSHPSIKDDEDENSSTRNHSHLSRLSQLSQVGMAVSRSRSLRQVIQETQLRRQISDSRSKVPIQGSEPDWNTANNEADSYSGRPGIKQSGGYYDYHDTGSSDFYQNKNLTQAEQKIREYYDPGTNRFNITNNSTRHNQECYGEPDYNPQRWLKPPNSTKLWGLIPQELPPTKKEALHTAKQQPGHSSRYVPDYRSIIADTSLSAKKPNEAFKDMFFKHNNVSRATDKFSEQFNIDLGISKNSQKISRNIGPKIPVITREYISKRAFSLSRKPVKQVRDELALVDAALIVNKTNPIKLNKPQPSSNLSHPEDGQFEFDDRMVLNSNQFKGDLPLILDSSEFDTAKKLFENIGLPEAPTKIPWMKGRLIGKGSFGHVYLALNLSTYEVMAVKQIKIPHFKPIERGLELKRKKFIESLHSEISMLKDLDHVNIVQYLGFEIKDQLINIFLEYVSGGTISSLIVQHGPLAEPVIYSFLNQILLCLDYLHSRNIIHRDIKSANILVEEDGTCKLSDFGISKKSNYKAAYESKSRMSVQGSIFWMAPEIVKGANYSAKVDIWSLGCVFLEMWTGRRPWYGFDTVQVMFKLGEGNSPPLPDDLPYDGVVFGQQCLCVNPKQRPTANDLLKLKFAEPLQNYTYTDYYESTFPISPQHLP